MEPTHKVIAFLIMLFFSLAGYDNFKNILLRYGAPKFLPISIFIILLLIVLIALITCKDKI